VKSLFIILLFCIPSFALWAINPAGGSIRARDSMRVDSLRNSLLIGTDADGKFVKRDSSRASGYADSARVARIMIHGVTPGTLPKAASDSTFDNSHVSESGDTTRIEVLPDLTQSSYNDTMRDDFEVSESPLSSWWVSCSGYGVNWYLSATGGYAYAGYGKSGVSLCDVNFGPDQTAQCELSADGGYTNGVIVRGDASGLTTDGYYYTYTWNYLDPGYSYSTSLYKVVGGAKTILSNVSFGSSVEFIKLAVAGDSLFAYDTSMSVPTIRIRDTSIVDGKPGMYSSTGRSSWWKAWVAARTPHVDTFTNTSLSTLTFDHGCATPNGDCYFFDSGSTSTVYIQSGGSGALSNLSQTSRAWTSSCAIPNGNVYASVGSDSIYKRIGGTGNFVRINAGYNISGMAYSTYDNTIYMSGNNKIYVADTGLSTIIDLGATSTAYGSICALKNGDLYVVRPGAGMVVRYSGQSAFVPFGSPSASWLKPWRDSSDNLYVSKVYNSRDGYSIYRKLEGESSISWYQGFSGTIRAGFYKSNGDMYALGTQAIYTKGTELTKTIFNVAGGNTKLGGKLIVENIPITTTPEFLLTMNAPPDYTVSKSAIGDSIAKAGNADMLDGFHKTQIDSLYQAAIRDSLNQVIDTLKTLYLRAGSSSNNGTIDSTGYRATGTAIDWEDLNFDPTSSGGPVATRPDPVIIDSVSYVEFTSANNQHCGDTKELPHGSVLGDSLYPHAHIFLKSGESEGATGVTFTMCWQLRSDGATTRGRFTMSATSAELAADGNEVVITGPAFYRGTALGGQLAMHPYRTAGDAGDVIVITYGVHYSVDRLGSNLITTK